MPNLNDVTTRVQALLDDVAATYTTPEFLNPLINQKYEELYNRLRLTGADFDETVTTLTAVPANTSTLSSYQATGQPLALLVQPTMLEWKLTGVDPTNYLEADYLEKVRDVIAGPLVDSWEWRQNIINLTPATIITDLRITGHSLLAPLNDPSSAIAIAQNMTHVLAYMTASLVGKVRGNEQWAKDYQDDADRCYDDLAQLLSRAELRKVYRVARASRSQQWRRTPF